MQQLQPIRIFKKRQQILLKQTDTRIQWHRALHQVTRIYYFLVHIIISSVKLSCREKKSDSSAYRKITCHNFQIMKLIARLLFIFSYDKNLKNLVTKNCKAPATKNFAMRIFIFIDPNMHAYFLLHLTHSEFIDWLCP